MNRRQLAKINKILAELSKAPRGRKANDFIRIAKTLGRKRAKRGKEPTWIRVADPRLSCPLSIPNHTGDMKPGTARSIVDQLQDDADVWAQWLDEHEAEKDDFLAEDDDDEDEDHGDDVDHDAAGAV